MSQSKRATVYFNRDLHRALGRKAETTDRSVSRPVNEAVRMALAEDDEDLKAFQSRAQERNLDFNKVVLSLRRRAKL